MANANLTDILTSPAGVAVGSSPTLYLQAMIPSDVNGNLQQSVAGPNSGLSYTGVALFRDAFPTVQATQSRTSPTLGQVVCTITPGTAGLWEVSGLLEITGTTVAATDSNNVALNQTGTARLSPIMALVPGTTGMTQPVPLFGAPVILNLSAVDTVNVTAIAAGTASSVYTVTLIARRCG